MIKWCAIQRRKPTDVVSVEGKVFWPGAKVVVQVAAEELKRPQPTTLKRLIKPTRTEQ